mmetsp:Transcript_18984/g.43632  ORF Transcript_18984/g.43632 Transcript_18984/m.43632 type:complete len:568 (-) Transcript_18984:2448-4151(-)
MPASWRSWGHAVTKVRRGLQRKPFLALNPSSLNTRGAWRLRRGAARDGRHPKERVSTIATTGHAVFRGCCARCGCGCRRWGEGEGVGRRRAAGVVSFRGAHVDSPDCNLHVLVVCRAQFAREPIRKVRAVLGLLEVGEQREDVVHGGVVRRDGDVESIRGRLLGGRAGLQPPPAEAIGATAVAHEERGEATDRAHVDQLHTLRWHFRLSADDLGDSIGGRGVEATREALELHGCAHSDHVERAVEHELPPAVQHSGGGAVDELELVPLPEVVPPRPRGPVGPAALLGGVGAAVDLEVRHDGPGLVFLAVAVVRGEQVDVALDVQREGGGRVVRVDDGERLGVVDARPAERGDAHEEATPRRVGHEGELAAVGDGGGEHGRRRAVAVGVLPQLDGDELALVAPPRVGAPRDGVALPRDELIAEARRVDSRRAAEALEVRAARLDHVAEGHGGVEERGGDAAAGGKLDAGGVGVAADAPRDGAVLGRVVERLVGELLHPPAAVLAVRARRAGEVHEGLLLAAEHGGGVALERVEEGVEHAAHPWVAVRRDQALGHRAARRPALDDAVLH